MASTFGRLANAKEVEEAPAGGGDATLATGAAGLEPAAPPRRHFISLPCSPEPEHGAAVLSGWHVTRRPGTSTRSLLHACFVSLALPGLTGAEIPAERCLPPPRRHYLASQLPVRLNLGSSGLSAPPCQPCTATASSCRAARKVQGQACAQATCRRPRAASRPGRSWQCPSYSRRHHFIPHGGDLRALII